MNARYHRKTALFAGIFAADPAASVGVMGTSPETR
jgi:hypothetical protein